MLRHIYKLTVGAAKTNDLQTNIGCDGKTSYNLIVGAAKKHLQTESGCGQDTFTN